MNNAKIWIKLNQLESILQNQLNTIKTGKIADTIKKDLKETKQLMKDLIRKLQKQQ